MVISWVTASILLPVRGRGCPGAICLLEDAYRQVKGRLAVRLQSRIEAEPHSSNGHACTRQRSHTASPTFSTPVASGAQ
ncbi:hypothetical protein QO004_005521 [Rhizobium mesoamericanum]|nr:hypothetical protein [Rhizobium mesoamericanum]